MVPVRFTRIRIDVETVEVAAGDREPQPVSGGEVSQYAATLRQMGVGLKISRAWKGMLRQGPSPQVVFDGIVGGQPVKGILDPFDNGAGYRMYVFLKDERSPNGNEDLFAFEYQQVVYVVWAGEEGWYESLHFEPRGLIREVQLPKI